MTHANTTPGHYTGGKRTRTYRSWEAMLGRCTNSKDLAYYGYGGRGITVCSDWKLFENFLADLGECPEDCVLDRINNEGNYEKDSCRWATRAESGQNTSTTVLTFENVVEIKRLLRLELYSRAKIARMFEVTPQTIHHIKSGKRWRNVP